MNIFDQYFKLQEEIYNYFGFKEDWAVFPLDDRREYDWRIVDEDTIEYGKQSDIVDNTGDQYFEEILKHRFYDKNIYRGQDYTLIMVDTHVDGNKFLTIYDNSKQLDINYERCKR